MPISDPAPSLGDAAGLVDYAKTLDCIRCGLCLQGCPTFRLTGVEASSPRGRIHLMRAAAEGRVGADEAFIEEMDYCLLCLRCESMCPAGVRFGEMVEFTRGELTRTIRRPLPAKFARWLGFRVVLPSRLLTRFAASLLRLVQLTRTEKLAGLVTGKLGAGMSDLPRVPSLPERRLLPERTPAVGEERDRVAVLEGCVMPELFSHVNRATVDSLAALGVTSLAPRRGTCCGSLHAHNGEMAEAMKLARRTISAFEECGAAFEESGDAPVVVNSAGCGAHMRHYPRLFAEDDPWRARAEAFAARVVDYSEYVAPRLEERASRLVPNVLPQPVAWDDPCHLCHGQGIRAEPHRILAAIDGLETVDLPDSEACCGSAGIYSLLRPDDSRAVFDEKLAALQRCGARTLITANPGCQMQWTTELRRRGVAVPVLHIAEVVARALATRDG